MGLACMLPLTRHSKSAVGTESPKRRSVIDHDQLVCSLYPLTIIHLRYASQPSHLDTRFVSPSAESAPHAPTHRHKRPELSPRAGRRTPDPVWSPYRSTIVPLGCRWLARPSLGPGGVPNTATGAARRRSAAQQHGSGAAQGNGSGWLPFHL